MNKKFFLLFLFLVGSKISFVSCQELLPYSLFEGFGQSLKDEILKLEEAAKQVGEGAIICSKKFVSEPFLVIANGTMDIVCRKSEIIANKVITIAQDFTKSMTDGFNESPVVTGASIVLLGVVCYALFKRSQEKQEKPSIHMCRISGCVSGEDK